jgi:hypothetical protein
MEAFEGWQIELDIDIVNLKKIEFRILPLDNE